MNTELAIAVTRARMVCRSNFDRAVKILSNAGMAMLSAAHYVLALLRAQRCTI